MARGSIVREEIACDDADNCGFKKTSRLVRTRTELFGAITYVVSLPPESAPPACAPVAICVCRDDFATTLSLMLSPVARIFAMNSPCLTAHQTRLAT